MKSLALLGATLAIALPLIEAQSAQAKTSKKNVSQTTRKRSRAVRVAVRLSPIIPLRSPQISPRPVTYVYSAPSALSMIDRPICFIERSDGTFLDLSNLCGMKAKTDPLNLNPNSTMPSYPIYPEDRQPQ